MSRAAHTGPRTAATHGRRAPRSATLDPGAASRSAGRWSHGTQSPVQEGSRLMGALEFRWAFRGRGRARAKKETRTRSTEQGRRRTCVLISTLLYPCALGMVTYELTRTAMQHELHEHLHPHIRPSQTRGIGLRRKTIRALVGASSDRCEGGMAGVVHRVEDPHCVCSLDQ